MRSIKSVEKGLMVLEAMANFPDGTRVRDIPAALGDAVSNPTLFLNSLINAGFVSKDAESGRYYVTSKISELAKKVESSYYSLLKQVAKHEITRLRDDLNENVLLAVIDGHDIHFIERLQSKRSVQILQDPRAYYPPHVTAGGKSILAFLGEDQIERYLSEALYHKFTEKSLVNPSSLRQELDTVRGRGFAVNRGEFETEIMAVACPIWVRGEVAASVVVQFPSYRYEIQRLPEFAERIRAAAEGIGEGLA